MWMKLTKLDQLKFVELKDRTSLGSADSNSVVVKGRGVEALHAYITKNQDQWIYRDFARGKDFHLPPNDQIDIGDWRAKFSDFSSLLDKHYEQLKESFKSILKENTDTKLPLALQKFNGKWFLSSSTPRELEKKLEQSFNEFELNGPIERLLLDDEITDILVSAYDQIWIERAGRLVESAIHFTSEESYHIYIENLLARLHKTIDEHSPFVDFKLPDDSRAHLIMAPVTGGSLYLSIRKIPARAWALNELLSKEMFSPAQNRILNNALQKKSNILISGATGSGKTTLLKALLSELESNERTIVIEDLPELKVGRKNTVYLCTRFDAQGRLPEINLRHLVKQSLRMRPDRLVIGEVRGEEALDLLHAMNTGHRGSMFSLHANSARDAIWRLRGLVQFSEASLRGNAILDFIARNIQLIVHCGRGENGRRQVQEIARVKGLCGEQILLESLEE